MGVARDGSDDVLRSRGHLVLTSFSYVPQSHSGSHVRLRYEHAEMGAVRNVDVPLHDEVKIGTLKSIADQCGADDFRDWCRWIDEHA